MQRYLNHRRNMRGFTLIEIMVVVVIIGILASIVIPKIISRPQQARIVKAKQDILSIENAMQLYKLDSGFYPNTEQGIAALVTKPGSDPVPTNWQPYLKEVPTDPWGKPYHYANPGQHGDIDIFSYGPTGQPGGSGENATIGNWSK
ncbi:MAG: type II secretion system major pseudopilin GspG [Gammaproteobacteria bacterium]